MTASGKRMIWRNPALLVLPLAAFLTVFYLVPVIVMLVQSTGKAYDFKPFADVFSSTIALRIFWQTVRLAVISTLVTFLLAYPLAFFIASCRPLAANILLAVVMLPFWTSILIRSYAWMVLLGRQGVLNGLMQWLGITSEPIKLLNTSFAVYIGMIHILLPFMILPIYGSLKALDGRLVAAAENLGAGTVSVFRYVIFPLSLPGVMAGSVLVFVLALGFYITPALLGGPTDMTISMMVAEQVDLYRWDFAAALATVLLITTMLIIFVVSRIISFEKLVGGVK
jgi:ABC-type spermidine/putrescine transport system permease subunit I